MLIGHYSMRFPFQCTHNVELFFDEKPLYDVFFSLVLGRCQDVVISIRGEATHVWLERCVEL